ncbi:ABC transporter ATP-binding protein [Ilumatobacter nonamiensis]|uniref:ABC transporter ATP-binding protein n=1 Tax=Ilumatobacter nonamiensis TaxID=467093 RepID=UPI00034D2B6C|nr:ATP-binding cassette domain-containing protein [Ilumatobacter nonamiensis]
MAHGLVVSGLHKRFGDTIALNGCDLSVEPGQLVGFLGPNGAGKSTAMRSIMGLITTDSGTVEWNGRPIDRKLRRRFGYMPQERGLYTRMRLREQVAYFGRLGGLDAGRADERADELLARVGLTERADDDVQDLSTGNQQRVQLAVSLVHQPDLLVLDEPFAGLDPLAIDVLRDIITERTADGAAVVFSSHQLDLVQELCRDVVIIDGGEVIDRGHADEIRARSDSREVEVTWGDEVAGAAGWAPPDAIETVDPSGRTVFRVSATSDPTALMESAAQVGTVTSFRFEPPSLDAVFAELVTDRRAARDETGGPR